MRRGVCGDTSARAALAVHRMRITSGVIHSAPADDPAAHKTSTSTATATAGRCRGPGHPPCRHRQRAGVHPSQVTRQVRELDGLGLVHFTADTADKRSCHVTLTAAGSDELRSLTEEGLDRFASFVADWEPEEVRMLTALLQKLEQSKARAAARQRPPPGRHWARQAPHPADLRTTGIVTEHTAARLARRPPGLRETGSVRPPV
jgi:hypothetical protein